MLFEHIEFSFIFYHIFSGEYLATARISLKGYSTGLKIKLGIPV